MLTEIGPNLLSLIMCFCTHMDMNTQIRTDRHTPLNIEHI